MSSIKLIVAVNEKNQIGFKNGRLPWNIPKDLLIFKEKTMGQKVLMGVNTYNSVKHFFPHGFPGRKNLILTHQPAENFLSKITVYNQLDELLEKEDDFWVIGGSQIYDLFLRENLVSEIHLTRVFKQSDADVCLQYDLFDFTNFIKNQKEKGFSWTACKQYDFKDSSIGFDIYILKKV